MLKSATKKRRNDSFQNEILESVLNDPILNTEVRLEDEDDQVNRIPIVSSSSAENTVDRSQFSEEDLSSCLSKLDRSVFKLLKTVANENAFRKCIFLCGIDIERFEVDKLSTALIEEAIKIFKTIQTILTDQKEDSIDIFLQCYRFYKILPHRAIATTPFHNCSNGIVPPLILSHQQVEAKWRDLETLSSLCVGWELLRQSKLNSNKNGSFLDQLYSNLGVELFPLLPKTSFESVLLPSTSTLFPSSRIDIILRYVGNSTDNPSFRIINLFSVSPNNETQRDCNLNNKILLWKGAHLWKHLCIFRNGFESQLFMNSNLTANAMLFSDMFHVSLEESFSGEEFPETCVFLYEVALGNAHEGEFIVKELPKGFDSVICRGSLTPDPSQSIFDEDSCLIPLGKPKLNFKNPIGASTTTKYYIYRKEQVKLRYIVHVRFQPSENNLEVQNVNVKSNSNLSTNIIADHVKTNN